LTWPVFQIDTDHGSYQIIGVNTFLNPKRMAQHEIELAPSIEGKKHLQIKRLRNFQVHNAAQAPTMLENGDRGRPYSEYQLANPKLACRLSESNP